jgi:hypothetical protein
MNRALNNYDIDDIAQNFWDPDSGLEFHYNRADITWNSSWWYGEPVRNFKRLFGVPTE